MTLLDEVRPAIALRFGVTLDGQELGDFTGVKGLVVEHDVLEWAEGGENGFVHRLPGRVRYPQDIVLSRCTDRHSAALAAWFTRTRAARVLHSGAIHAYDGDEEVVAVWRLTGVWPVRYSGPVLDSVLGGPARETLALAHSGFVMTTPGAKAQAQ